MSVTPEKRVLSIQSSVVSGYVGNKSATFPLQLHGYDVSTINSVQFSNHTGYGKWKGQVLNAQEASDLFEGLRTNGLLNYSHVLTGYVGSDCFLRKVGEAVKEMKSKNPNLIYVCDPVMGDNGRLYVSEKLVPIYRTEIAEQADIITPNQFELEQLTQLPVTTETEAFAAMEQLHQRGVRVVVLSSSNLGQGQVMLCLASSREGSTTKKYRLKIPKLDAPFVGTGDLFAASLLTWMDKEKNLKGALERTVSIVQKVIKRTLEQAQSLAGPGVRPSTSQMELRLVQSKADIEDPAVDMIAEEVQ
ncbi:pyridoxal kinase [Aplysia californica]|uniref:Pyridoxal kinase n=1 Tax=Aplysia californica TaxID=6500 RepID=A0ABM0JEW9_APLCA|nr:pyridoxal kinase [Aplysia californica]